MSDLHAAERIIHYKFRDEKLLYSAFTHSSYVNEHSAQDNERIEFLGDCVLNFLVGERLYEENPRSGEGDLSSRRAALVSRKPLANLVDSLNLMDFLRVGAGVDKSAFSVKARSDLFEALLGAIYIDGGMDAARSVLDCLFFGNVKPERDFKSELQRRSAAHGIGVAYETEQASDGSFVSRVSFGERQFTGQGRTKHSAQIEAARAAIEALSQE